MVDAQFLRIEHRTEAQNITFIHQPLEPRLARRLGEADPFRQLQHRHAPVFAEGLENLEIEVVQIVCFMTISHVISRQF
ncbi:hypothetical protein D3C86_2067680 [compost metagenome]